MAKTENDRAKERKDKGLCRLCNNLAVKGGFCAEHHAINSAKSKAKRAAKKAAGMCSICGKVPPAEGLLDCLACRAKQKENKDKRKEPKQVKEKRVVYDKPWHQRNVEAGFCMTGGEKHGPPVEGHKLCQVCLDKKCSNRKKRIAKNQCLKCDNPAKPGSRRCQQCIDKAKAKRAANIAAGLCSECGTCPPLPNIKTCKRCNIKARKNDVARFNRIKEELRQHYGELQCYCCHESDPDLLELDHINNDGAAHRKLISGKNVGCGSRRFYLWLKKHDFPKGLQWSCATCNKSKHRFGECKHQQRTPESLEQLRQLNRDAKPAE